MKELAPVVLFVYNRPWHTEQTLKALSDNIFADQSILYVFIDGPKINATEEDKRKIEKVYEIIKSKQWCKDVIIFKNERNKGLANSIIDGVTQVVNKHGKVIVLEDDLLTSKYFLKYMNEALMFYEEDYRIMSISGYNHPKKVLKIPKKYKKDIYLSLRNSSWGWGTWQDRWNLVDWNVSEIKKQLCDKKLQKDFNEGGGDLFRMLIDQLTGKIDSWSIRFTYSHFKNKKYALYPVLSYVQNIGLDGTGTHFSGTKKLSNDLNLAKKDITLVKNIDLDFFTLARFKKVYSVDIFHRIKSFLKRKLLKQ